MEKSNFYESPALECVEICIEGTFCTMSSTEGLGENNGSWDFYWN